ncbi:nuclear transport factor 2 (NTF2) superfamily protein [Deinobacterium chartae]|uniref:Nuclear transport factor 2 (NTF2) superfamily protein n=1 Tax=Deinobacterium chartae TaxID=521158 RepID=A0A841HX96_9DEIO|nr:nuclear transport factor 2 family protein [Deinobacterium chartae]MBB6096869.1 nuclear transport factor 2 (NTF2) superfamily protein [Deinobacterium chartae]
MGAVSAPDAHAWLARLKSAWESRDADAAAALFAQDVLYCEDPFGEALRGREAVRAYWRAMLADQQDVRFAGEVLADTPQQRVIHWQVRYRGAGGAVELSGVSAGEPDATGLPRRWREWWHRRALQ